MKQAEKKYWWIRLSNKSGTIDIHPFEFARDYKVNLMSYKEIQEWEFKKFPSLHLTDHEIRTKELIDSLQPESGFDVRQKRYHVTFSNARQLVKATGPLTSLFGQKVTDFEIVQVAFHSGWHAIVNIKPNVDGEFADQITNAKTGEVATISGSINENGHTSICSHEGYLKEVVMQYNLLTPRFE